MAVEAERVFDLLEVAYRQGVLDRAMPLVGEALDDLREESGKPLSYFLTVMDEADDATLARLDRTLGRSGLLIRLATSERLMGLLSRALDRPGIRKMARTGIRKYFEKLLAKSEGVSAWPA